jgi:hypothetical protein
MKVDFVEMRSEILGWIRLVKERGHVIRSCEYGALC